MRPTRSAGSRPTGRRRSPGAGARLDISNLRKEAAAALGEIADPARLAALWKPSANDPDPRCPQAHPLGDRALPSRP